MRDIFNVHCNATALNHFTRVARSVKCLCVLQTFLANRCITKLRTTYINGMSGASEINVLYKKILVKFNIDMIFEENKRKTKKSMVKLPENLLENTSLTYIRKYLQLIENTTNVSFHKGRKMNIETYELIKSRIKDKFCPFCSKMPEIDQIGQIHCENEDCSLHYIGVSVEEWEQLK